MAVIIISVFMSCFSTFAAWVIQYLVILQANGDGDTMVMDTAVTVVHFILALQEQIMRLPLRCTSLSLFPPLQVRTLHSPQWLCGLPSAWLCVCWCCSSPWPLSVAGRSRRAVRRPGEKVRPAEVDRAAHYSRKEFNSFAIAVSRITRCRLCTLMQYISLLRTHCGVHQSQHGQVLSQILPFCT